MESAATNGIRTVKVPSDMNQTAGSIVQDRSPKPFTLPRSNEVTTSVLRKAKKS